MKQHKTDEYWIDLIISLLSGNATEEDHVTINEWINLSDDNRKLFDELSETWTVADVAKKDTQFSNNKAFTAFKGKVNKAKRISLLRLLPYAASVVLLIVSSYFIYSYVDIDRQFKEKTVVSKIIVPNGSKIQSELSDGTVLWLNAGSTVEMAADFGQKERRIKLYGEAYLDVAKNNEVPFIVETQFLDIKIHGTKFNVETYNEDGDVKVALIEGSVELLTKTGQSTFLKPSELAVYNISSSKINIISDGIGTSLAWRQNHLQFKDKPFDQIITELERKFGINVVIHNEALKERCFTGDFVNNETYEQIFKVMSSNGAFSYNVKLDSIDIY